MSLAAWVEYLKDPNLVARFQAYFGVRNGFEKNGPSTKVSKGSNLRAENLKRMDKDSYNNSRTGKVTDLCGNRSDDSSGISSGGSSCNSSNENSRSSSVSGSGNENDEDSCSGVDESVKRFVGNKWWYYLFMFGSGMGDEAFYACFFCFWFWNVDGSVGRRVVFLWAILMYIGQGLKDIIRWPRPASPPVIRLERKWELEYGMPSTHAIVGSSIPASIVIFTASRYQYPIPLGIVLAILWCTLVCSSRIYLGMHTVLDIIAGLSLVAVLLWWVIPFVDWLDPIFLQHEWGGLLLFLSAAILAMCSPGGDRWTPARGDTVVILGSCVGLNTGAWMNYQLGIIHGPPLDPPYPVIWPSYGMLGMSFLRLVIGLSVVVATRAIVKSAAYATLRGLVGSKDKSYITSATKREVIVELTYKFITYATVGFNVVYLAPVVFRYIGIERPTFHTEV